MSKQVLNMNLKEIFPVENIFVDLKSTSKEEVFSELIDNACRVNPDFDGREALDAVLEREANMTTGFIPKIAIPHGYCRSIKDCMGIIGISRKGIEYESLDGNPVHVVFMLLCGRENANFHLQILKDIVVLVQKKNFIEKILEKSVPEEIFDVLFNVE